MNENDIHEIKFFMNEIEIFMYKIEICMHEIENSMHENNVCMHENEISMHGYEISMHEMKILSQSFHRWECHAWNCDELFTHENFGGGKIIPAVEFSL